jgi:hypothetical protein
MAVRQVRKQRGGTKNQVSIVEVHLGSKLSVRATWGGHTHHEIYSHFTCDDEAGPFQWTCSAVFLLSGLDGAWSPHLARAPLGALFYLWLSINCGIGNNDFCSRAQLPCTPVVADSGRAAYTARLFHFNEWTCISQNFSDRRARAAKERAKRW